MLKSNDNHLLYMLVVSVWYGGGGGGYLFGSCEINICVTTCSILLLLTFTIS